MNNKISDCHDQNIPNIPVSTFDGVSMSDERIHRKSATSFENIKQNPKHNRKVTRHTVHCIPGPTTVIRDKGSMVPIRKKDDDDMINYYNDMMNHPRQKMVDTQEVNHHVPRVSRRMSMSAISSSSPVSSSSSLYGDKDVTSLMSTSSRLSSLPRAGRRASMSGLSSSYTASSVSSSYPESIVASATNDVVGNNHDLSSDNMIRKAPPRRLSMTDLSSFCDGVQS